MEEDDPYMVGVVRAAVRGSSAPAGLWAATAPLLLRSQLWLSALLLPARAGAGSGIGGGSSDLMLGEDQAGPRC